MKSFPIEKIVVSGPVLEYFSYPTFPEYGVRSSREMAIQRARSTLRRKINANSGQWWNESLQCYYKPLFVTLTFADNVTDLKFANYQYKKFIQKFNRFVFKSKKNVLKYSVVIEWQERGAIHYHALFYNVPFFDLRKMLDLWPYGRQEVTVVKDVKLIGSYVVKYMTKEFDDIRFHGQKMYFGSRGLLKSLVVRDTEQILELLSFVDSRDLISSSDVEGVLFYRQYINDIFRIFNTSRVISASNGGLSMSYAQVVQKDQLRLL